MDGVLEIVRAMFLIKRIRSPRKGTELNYQTAAEFAANCRIQKAAVKDEIEGGADEYQEHTGF